MKVSVISFTPNGDLLNKRLMGMFVQNESEHYGNSSGLIKRTDTLKEWTGERFGISDALVFIGAAGIAVRAAAPFIKGKDRDSAVVVVDELGRFVIPVLSGHMGGANEIALKIAEYIGAVPVITTATDINGIWAADTWAIKHDCTVANIENIKFIAGALLRGQKIGFKCDFPIKGSLPSNVCLDEICECGIAVSLSGDIKPFKKTLNIIPKCIHIGIGSRKGAEANAIVDLYKEIQKKYSFSDRAVKSIATINIKKDEKAVKEFAKYLGMGLKIFDAEELNNAEGEFLSSDFVKKITGTDNVCERAAALSGGKKFIVRKTKGCGVTIAAAAEDWSADFEDSIGGNRL